MAVLALTFGLPPLAGWLARARPRVEAPMRWALALLLTANKVAVLGWGIIVQKAPWPSALPLHLCDVATVLLVACCVWRWERGYELAYFWGLAGTLQAVLTPDIREGFPSFRFVTFFLSHCGVVGGVIFLAVASGYRVGPGSIVRAFLWLQLYAVVAGGVNALAGTNYGYLCRKPQGASLMDYLGPWPWYILSLEAIALLSFAVYWLPFGMARGFAARRG